MPKIKKKRISKNKSPKKKITESKRMRKTTLSQKINKWRDNKLKYKNKKLAYKSRKQNLPNASFKRKMQEKAFNRSYAIAQTGQIMSPLIQYISVTADDNEKIRLAEIQSEMAKATTDAELKKSIEKIRSLATSIAKRNNDKDKTETIKTTSTKAKSNIVDTGININKWSATNNRGERD